MLIHNFDIEYERKGTDSQVYGVYGNNIIPLHVAETDFRSPEPVVNALTQRALHGLFGYVDETPTFQQAAAFWLSSRFNWKINPDWVEYSPSAGCSLAFCIQAFSQPGDRILIQTPVYQSFHALIENSGRNKEINPLKYKNGKYEVDFDLFEKQVSDPRVRLFIFCHPHNPVGKIWKRDELLRMANLCIKHGVYILSDEVHCDVILNDTTHIPMASLSDEIADNTMTTINPSKTFNLAGMRTAAAIVKNSDRRNQFRMRLLANKCMERPAFGLVAFETAYRQCGYYVDQLVSYVKCNADLVNKYFVSYIPELSLVIPEATYMVWVDASELEKKIGESAAEFLMNNAGIAVRDGIIYGENGKGFFRMNIGIPKSSLIRVLDLMRQSISETRGS